ncbi:hypothetical protein GCM10018771_48930 [Streptomyces cellulosae]|nr:hypothetical protein GCM10018771_48930 [Streptomyces cellulosae]
MPHHVLLPGAAVRGVHPADRVEDGDRLDPVQLVVEVEGTQIQDVRLRLQRPRVLHQPGRVAPAEAGQAAAREHGHDAAREHQDADDHVLGGQDAEHGARPDAVESGDGHEEAENPCHAADATGAAADTPHLAGPRHLELSPAPVMPVHPHGTRRYARRACNTRHFREISLAR